MLQKLLYRHQEGIEVIYVIFHGVYQKITRRFKATGHRYVRTIFARFTSSHMKDTDPLFAITL